MDPTELGLLGIRRRNCCIHQIGETDIEARTTVDCIAAGQELPTRTAVEQVGNWAPDSWAQTKDIEAPGRTGTKAPDTMDTKVPDSWAATEGCKMGPEAEEDRTELPVDCRTEETAAGRQAAGKPVEPEQRKLVRPVLRKTGRPERRKLAQVLRKWVWA